MKFTKEIRLKELGGGTVTVTQIQKINSYSLSELTPAQIYVRKFLLAHNAVDRDRERFSEECLDGFMQTLPGKSVLRGHNRAEMPCGLFFDASVEEMSKAQFKTLTGEDAILPDGMTMVKVLYGHVYFLKNDTTRDLIASMDAGILRYVSIGFRAADRTAIKSEFGETLFVEYVAPAKALEGSIVWLGAQPGALIKGASGRPESRKSKNPLDFDNEEGA